MENEKIKILFFNKDIAGVNYYRTLTPAMQLERDHSDKFHVVIDSDINFDNYDEALRYLKTFQIIHYHRYIIPSTQGMIQLTRDLRANGTILVMDIDDYWMLDKSHPFYSTASKNNLHLDIIDNLKLADYVTTTTDIFATEIKKITNRSNVIVLENSVNPEWMKQFQSNRVVDPKNRQRITYMAGSCYDKETEILTENGWKLFSELNKTERVATLNCETNELEYQQPTHYTDEYYIGDMYYGKSKNIDFALTPNHNVFVSKTKSGNRKKPFKFELSQMDTLDSYDLIFKKDVIWNNNSKNMDYFILPKYESKLKNFDEVKFEINDWMKIFGYWIGDGWTTKDGSNQVGIGGIKLESIKVIKELEIIFKKYGYKPTWTKDGKQMRIFNQQLFMYLNKFGNANEKYIPKEFKMLPKKQLEILLNYYLKADGTLRINGRISCDTVSLRLANDISEIGLKVGCCSTFTNRGIRTSFIDEKDDDGGLIVKRKITGKYDNLHINFYKNSIKSQMTPTVLRKNIIKKKYEGNIYCVTVSNHIIYVRRNGLSYWCGNSHKQDIQQLDGVAGRLQSDVLTRDQYQFILAGWDTEGATTDIVFNQEYAKALIKRNMWNQKIIKSTNKSEGNVDLIEGLPADIRERFRNNVFTIKKRAINSVESVYLDYEKIFTDNFRSIKNDDYNAWLQKFERDKYYDESLVNYVRRWTQKANSYALVLDETDISLAPLVDNLFNRMKSNLKQVEVWSRKLPIVCSDIPPYNVDGKHMKNCILIPFKKRNEKEWAKAMKILITEPNLRNDLGNQLHEDFKVKYNLKHVTNTRAEFYKTIVHQVVTV